MNSCGSDGGDMCVSRSMLATHRLVRTARPRKSFAAPTLDRKQLSKYGYFDMPPQPNEVRSLRAAVRIMRFGPARGRTKVPEKHAEIMTTVGRPPQESETIASSLSGERMRSPSTSPPGVPCELK